MKKYKWVIIDEWEKYSSPWFKPSLIEGGIAAFIYDVDGGLIYRSDWEKAYLDYVPKELSKELEGRQLTKITSNLTTR